MSSWSPMNPDYPMAINSDYRRRNSGESDCWFTLELPSNLLLGDFNGTDTSTLYNEFGKWFENECDGSWAYPSPDILLFELEEDKVKVILKYL